MLGNGLNEVDKEFTERSHLRSEVLVGRPFPPFKFDVYHSKLIPTEKWSCTNLNLKLQMIDTKRPK